MADISSDLIYEILKNIQQELRSLKDGQGEIRHELIAIRGHLVSINQDVSNIYVTLGRHETRLDRIDRRLELREFAEAPSPFEHK